MAIQYRCVYLRFSTVVVLINNSSGRSESQCSFSCASKSDYDSMIFQVKQNQIQVRIKFIHLLKSHFDCGDKDRNTFRNRMNQFLERNFHFRYIYASLKSHCVSNGSFEHNLQDFAPHLTAPTFKYFTVISRFKKKLMLSPFAIRDDDSDFTHHKSSYQLNRTSTNCYRRCVTFPWQTHFFVSVLFLFFVIIGILVWLPFLDFNISLLEK